MFHAGWVQRKFAHKRAVARLANLGMTWVLFLDAFLCSSVTGQAERHICALIHEIISYLNRKGVKLQAGKKKKKKKLTRLVKICSNILAWKALPKPLERCRSPGTERFLKCKPQSKKQKNYGEQRPPFIRVPTLIVGNLEWWWMGEINGLRALKNSIYVFKGLFKCPLRSGRLKEAILLFCFAVGIGLKMLYIPGSKCDSTPVAATV